MRKAIYAAYAAAATALTVLGGCGVKVERSSAIVPAKPDFTRLSDGITRFDYQISLLDKARSAARSASSQPYQPALLPYNSRIIDVGDAQPLAAAREYCNAHPDDCKNGEPLEFVLEPRHLASAMAVHELLKSMWVYKRDRDQADCGKLDCWKKIDPDKHFATEIEGDCEDFAILMKTILVKLGWNPAAIQYLIVKLPDTASSELHLVAKITTSHGDFVSDLNMDTVMPLSTAERFYSQIVKKNVGDDVSKWRAVRSVRHQVQSNVPAHSAVGRWAVRMIAPAKKAQPK